MRCIYVMNPYNCFFWSFPIIPGMSGPMLWLQNCLNKTAEDREEDGENIIDIKIYFISILFSCNVCLFNFFCLQVSHRLSHLFLSRRQMKKPWKTRISGSFYGNLESELLQMNRCVGCSLYLNIFKWIHTF